MYDVLLFLGALISLLSVIIVSLILYRNWAGHYQSDDDESEENESPHRAPGTRPANTSNIPPVPGLVPRGNIRAQRNVRQRMRAAAAREDSEDEDEEFDPLSEDIALPDGKLGAKKRKKLEQKAEKRAAREREVEEREERKQRQQALEEQRKKDEERDKMEEAKLIEEEVRLKEEKEKQELEEYMKMKEAFAVEEEGFDENEIEDQNTNKFQEFIDYINNEKVVLLEELAAHFKLKTQDCVDRVQSLMEQEQIMGVIDDRGKFIAITQEELELVARFIRQRGRVLISELVDSSNQLIRLQQPQLTS